MPRYIVEFNASMTVLVDAENPDEAGEIASRYVSSLCNIDIDIYVDLISIEEDNG